MKKTGTISLLTAALLLTACGDDNNDKDKDTLSLDTEIFNNTVQNPWYTDAAVTAASVTTYDSAANRGKAKNVILFVGDGMGVSTVTAARILEGQQKGMMGEDNVLSFGAFPFAGLAKTYNVDAQTPDSAGTMTAMMSGVKTDAGTIGVDEDIVRGDCTTVAGNELVSALELAEIAGLSTGVVSTARITHATPAATYANEATTNFTAGNTWGNRIEGGNAYLSKNGASYGTPVAVGSPAAATEQIAFGVEIVSGVAVN